MKEYYFLASVLPILEIGHIPALGFVEFIQLCEVNLTPSDFKKVVEMRRLIDLENLRALWGNQPIDPRGNLNQEELEQALVDQMWSDTEEFPLYLIDFLAKYPDLERRIRHFPNLLSDFFMFEHESRIGFLQDYFAFQKEWRLVILGFRSKALGRDLAYELQYEDGTDPIVSQILAQKDAKVYEPPFEYQELKPLFEHHKQNPLELHQALIAYQFDYMIERWGGELFTIDRILNYMARLILVERWNELDLHKGMEVIDTIERNVS